MFTTEKQKTKKQSFREIKELRRAKGELRIRPCPALTLAPTRQLMTSLLEHSEHSPSLGAEYPLQATFELD
jgi:hypothetical protein